MTILITGYAHINRQYVNVVIAANLQNYREGEASSPLSSLL